MINFLYITLNKGRKINPCINPIFREKWLINLLAHQYWDLCPLQKIDAELILMQAWEKHVYNMKNRIKSVQENDWQRNWCWINSHVSVREYAYEIRIKSVQGKWLRKSWIIIKLKSPYKNAQALGYIQLTFFWWHLRKLSYQIVMQHKLPCSIDMQIASDSCKWPIASDSSK